MKYYPDRFYIELNDFDPENLTTFLSDLKIEKNQAVFIHEYYHYLTNLTTFSGLRQFVYNFVYRHILVTNFVAGDNLNAFPINENKDPAHAKYVEDWNYLIQQSNDEDLDYNLAQVCLQSHSNFRIDNIIIKSENRIQHGLNTVVEQVNILINGNLGIDSFVLTYGAVDEFLSSSIDEYLFEKGYSELDIRTLNDRPQYPYRTLDSILSYYGIRANALEKILISYFALHSEHPPVVLIGLLNELKEIGFEKFQENPEGFLNERIRLTRQDFLISKVYEYAESRYNNGAIHISQALKYYGDKFYSARKFLDLDFFYFIRPFFEFESDERGKQRFLLSLSRILNQFLPPVMLKDRTFKVVDKVTNFGETTLFILATYEIFESLKAHKFAHRSSRQSSKYDFQGDPGSDNWRLFSGPPIPSHPFKIALNELSLYGLYLREQ